MEPFLQDRIEDYLNDRLPPAERERFEALLAEDSDAAEVVAGFLETATLFEAIRAPEEEIPSLTPGFYVRLRQTIDEENQVPFWAAFLQPFLLKRLAFAALMWMFALGSVTLMSDGTPQRNTELADMFLSAQPPEQYHVRMGPNLEQNRDSMLAVMFRPGQK
ncbi:MAG: hypothetical protein GC160_29710 [Acidobacteria bacterium]|nr:hypothetical protein [Acidobacteriota bacterium]